MITILIIILNLINRLIKKFYFAIKKKNVTYSLSLPIILSNLNINVNDLDTNLSQLSYSVFILSLIALLCFINILGFMLTYILIQKSNWPLPEIKYPKLTKIINYYKKSSLIYLSIEVLLCFTCLFLLVLFSLLYLISGTQ